VTDPATLRETRVRARTFASRLEDVAEEFVGRDEVMRVLGLATLCREHVLLIGPPGTAKTLLVDKFRRMLDVCYFSYLLTRFTEPAELFGPMDIEEFRKNKVFRIHTAGMLPEAQLAFLDEIFQGSSAILNTLLTLINERKFHNGSDVTDVPLLTMLGSTNELPDDPVLAAFSDRFLLRIRLSYVSSEEIEQVLNAGWKLEREQAAMEVAPGNANRNEVRFNLSHLQALQREVTRIDLSPVREHLARMISVLRNREGVALSDRRAVKAQKLIAASALLDARRTADDRDLGVLAYLWTRDNDEETIRRVLAEHEVPVGVRLRQQRSRAAIMREANTLAGQSGTREELRAEINRLHELSLEAKRDHPDDAALLTKIKYARNKAMAALRRRFEEGMLLDV
jgi:MoxR-like ATPase